ncbi:MAG: hypothetical protein LBD97_06530, partial [Bifidobacteriaceae bacterium]|nr:hypothetical protein [Bifidobacteriaceae bacterium]
MTISGGVVTATGRGYGTGIGGGGSSSSSYLGSGGDITISGGVVTATAGGGGAGIGGGNLQDGGVILISGGTVNAAGQNGAGIGGGYGGTVGGSGGVITISGGFVTASTSGTYSSPAAIGGGANGVTGAVSITGGAVVALAPAGWPSIGGSKSGGSITITGGTVIGVGAGIGAGSSPAPSIVSPTVVMATSAKNATSSGANGQLYGADVTISADSKTITLKADLTVPVGGTLTIPPGWTLIVADPHTLDIAAGAELDIWGQLDVESGATIANQGDVIVEDGATVNIDGGRTGDLLRGAPVAGAVTLDSRTTTSLTVNPVSIAAATGQDVEYGIATTDTVPSGSWQSTTTFDNLTSGTTYHVFARSAANSDFSAGPAQYGQFETVADVTVGLLTVGGVVAPVVGGVPVSVVAETDQYTGSVVWSPVVGSGGFAPGVEYVATVTLVAKPGFTFVGVGEDAFEVVGAVGSVNSAGSGTIRATFARTDVTVGLLTVGGVVAPVVGGVPVSVVAETDQYTGSV